MAGPFDRSRVRLLGGRHFAVERTTTIDNSAVDDLFRINRVQAAGRNRDFRFVRVGPLDDPATIPSDVHIYVRSVRSDTLEERGEFDQGKASDLTEDLGAAPIMERDKILRVLGRDPTAGLNQDLQVDRGLRPPPAARRRGDLQRHRRASGRGERGRGELQTRDLRTATGFAMCQARPCIDAAVIQHQRGAAGIDGEAPSRSS